MRKAKLKRRSNESSPQHKRRGPSKKALEGYLLSEWFGRPSEMNVHDVPGHLTSAVNEADAKSSEVNIRSQLLERLETFEYPYPEGRFHGAKRKRSFYDRVVEAGLFDNLLDGNLFRTIRLWWFFLEAERLEKKKKRKGRSEYGYPIDFHRETLAEFLRHALTLHRLRERYEVPATWLSAHLQSTDLQLARDTSVFYSYSPCAKQQSRTFFSYRSDAQLEIFDAISLALQKQKNKRA